jgi:hypothetical protein
VLGLCANGQSSHNNCIASNWKYVTNVVLLLLLLLLFLLFHVKWVPYHQGMARPQVANGKEGLQIRRVAVNIPNKQSRAADKGWSSNLGVGRGACIPSP